MSRERTILPGLGLTLGCTVFYVSLLVLVPLAMLFVKAATLSWAEFWQAASAPRVVAAYRLSLFAAGASACGAVWSVVAWVLVRYDFTDGRHGQPVDLPLRADCSRQVA